MMGIYVEFDGNGESVMDALIDRIEVQEEIARVHEKKRVRHFAVAYAEGLRTALEYIDAVFRYQNHEQSEEGRHGVPLRKSQKIIKERKERKELANALQEISHDD